MAGGREAETEAGASGHEAMKVDWRKLSGRRFDDWMTAGFVEIT